MLYEKIDWKADEIDLPEYISQNLNPNFELRPYQVKAFKNFIAYFEDKRCPHPLQVLFHMATGSGKTLIMAGLIVYLYRCGYRNFLFFVNLSNIVDKTRENFLNPASKKYLFAREIIIDGERIRVNVTENFRQAEAGAINICFSTTQGLHSDLTFAKEGGMTFDDFNELKVVLISDEAHHLNASTKKNSADKVSWEETVGHLFRRNTENILLEFTATCNLKDPAIKRKYEDKIIFNYPLKNFYSDRYSKEIYTLRTDDLDSRILQALILSQYRLKIFQERGKYVKPVVLFKSNEIKISQKNMAQFIADVKNLRGEHLQKLSDSCGEIVRQAFDYFKRKNISLESLAAELRDDFSEAHCISANKDDDATANQILLNSLEDADNPYRAIFEVKKLDEGWDVLNLFDIVRLHDKRKKSDTISEAQLIGRGARYFPFKVDDEQPKYQRKFDGDTEDDLRICETLYYHCQDDSRYIAELHKALQETGLDVDKPARRYELKESFKRGELYQSGVIYLNRREEVGHEKISFSKIHSYDATKNFGQDNVMTLESADEKISTRTTHTTLAEINFATVHKALRRYPIYKFDNLKARFPDLKSTREFITDEKYLGGVKIAITSGELNAEILFVAVCDLLNKIAAELAAIKTTYRGTKTFSAKKISEIFRDKSVNSQEKTGIDIGDDWFAYGKIYGTSEEKSFVEYFAGYVDELKNLYDKIYLVHNERECAIYSFEGGRRFEPDYILFLQKKNAVDRLQIFIEPKGEHLAAIDAWKEDFLRELEAEVLIDDDRYKIFGLPFFNQNTLEKFDSEFGVLLK